jgi:SAM-dependent methyltransferase
VRKEQQQVGDLGRYERFGWDYETFNPLEERAVAWYLRHAREVGGPVLEVACGTGPLLAELARDGHEVVGLDLADSMLALARRRIAGLPDHARGRVTLARADMCDFRLEGSFALALVADNSLREAGTRADVARSLACIRRHLRPEGRLLVTERRFDPSRYPGGEAVWPYGEPLVDPETGSRVQRRIHVRLDEEARELHGVMTYRTTDREGVTTTEDFPFWSPILAPADYAAMFEAAGFTSRLCVGYEDRPDDGRDPMLCFVATPA